MSEWDIQALRVQERKHIPTVLTKEEVEKIIFNLNGIYHLMTSLMYGCGLRMSELLSLRLKDIDFRFDKIYIWDSKSLKDRTLPLPSKLKTKLLAQVELVQELHVKDLADGYGTVYMPYAFEKNIQKRAERQNGNFYFL